MEQPAKESFAEEAKREGSPRGCSQLGPESASRGDWMTEAELGARAMGFMLAIQTLSEAGFACWWRVR